MRNKHAQALGRTKSDKLGENPAEQKVYVMLADVLRLQDECQRAYNRKCVARNDEKLQAQGYLQGLAQSMTILKLPTIGG